jgi:hypothetical protein
MISSPRRQQLYLLLVHLKSALMRRRPVILSRQEIGRLVPMPSKLEGVIASVT